MRYDIEIAEDTKSAS